MKMIEAEKIEFAQIADTAKVVAKTLAEPLHSAYVWLGNRDKGKWGEHVRAVETKKDENFPLFFNHKVEVPVAFPDLAETPKLLREMCMCFKERSGNPQCFIGAERYAKWQLVKEQLESELSEKMPGIKMIDYMVSRKHDYDLFFMQGDKLSVVKVEEDQKDFDAKKVWSQLIDSSKSVRIPMAPSDASEWLRGENGTSLPELELAMDSLANRNNPHSRREIKMVSTIANDFYYKRHSLLEREGLFFTGLRHMGVHSLGEMQNEARVLFDEGWLIDPESREVVINKDLLDTWVAIRNLPFGGEIDATAKDMTVKEAQGYINEQAYYRLIMEKLNGSELTQSFVKSDLYRKYALEFKDRHAASYGASELKIAESMLAGIYLLSYEGVPNPSNSPSQHYMAEVKGYYHDLENFIAEFSGNKPEYVLATSTKTDVDKKNILKRLISSFKLQELEKIGLDKMRCTTDTIEKALSEAKSCMNHARGEMSRNPVHRKVIDIFHNLGLIVSDGIRSRVGMGDTFVGNLMLRTVDIHGEKRFTFPWLKQASGYLGPDREKDLPEISESKNIPMDTVIRDIFSGQIDELGHPYLTQEARVFKHAGTILKYMCEDQNAPLSVRKFAKALSSRESIVKVLETMGSISDNDPNIINRFFPSGLQEFHKASIYRYVFDFVRGVESNLVIAQGEKKGGIYKVASMADMWAGNWRNRDFSSIDSETINAALKETFHDGHSRLLELNHAVGDIDKLAKALGLDDNEMQQVMSEKYEKTWKTLQEKLEVVFGWDTTAMKYLRWQEMWNVWNTFGAAWDCICFTRKTIFNPKPLKATY